MIATLSHPFLSVFLACIAPTAAFCALNLVFYTTRQILGSLAIVSVLGLVLGISASWLHELIANTQPAAFAASFGMSLPDAAVCALSLCCFFFLSERFFRELIPNSAKRRLVLFSISALSILLSCFLTLLPVNMILLFHVFFSCIDAKRNYKKEKEYITLPFSDKKRSAGSNTTTITLTKKPNIYLLILESYQSKDVLQEFYGINDTKTEKFMKQKGFHIYKNIFANYQQTAPSANSLLNCSLSNQPADPPFVLQVLYNSGYSFEFFDSYIFTRLACTEDFTSFSMPAYGAWLYRLAGPLFSQSQPLLKLIGNFDPLTPKFDFSHTLQTFKKRLSLPAKQPRFFALRFGAGHRGTAAWEKDGGLFSEQYKKTLVPRAQKQIRTIVTIITAHDPDGLIIALGDHGARRNSNAYEGKGTAEEVLKARGVTVRELALDFFSVFLAIRWPVPHKTSGKTFSHVNLFRFVFEALGGGEDLLRQLSPDVSILDMKFIVARDGRPLEALEEYAPKAVLDNVIQQYQDGRASLQDHLHLYDALPKSARQKLQLVENMQRRFPDEPTVQRRIGTLYCASGNKDGLELLRKAANSPGAKESMFLEYARNLLFFGRHRQALEFLSQVDMKKNHKAAFMTLSASWALGLADEALKQGEAFLALCPNSPYGYLSVALLLQEQNNVAAALSVLDKGLSRKAPKGKFIHFYPLNKTKALLLLKLGDYAAAENVLTRIAQKPHIQGWGIRLLAYAMEKLGKVDQAIEVFQDAIAHKTDSQHIGIGLGYVAMRNTIDSAELQPFVHLAKEELDRSAAEIGEGTLFSSSWYQKQYDVPPSLSPLQHYIMEGAYRGATPNPWFNPITYISFNKTTVWTSGRHPMIQYHKTDLWKLRKPSLRYTPASLLWNEPDLRKDKKRFLHFLCESWAEVS